MGDDIAFFDAHGGSTALGIDLSDNDTFDVFGDVMTLTQGLGEILHGDASDEFRGVGLRLGTGAWNGT